MRKHTSITYGIKNRKGLSSVVGTVFFIIVFTSVASYIIFSMNQIDKFGEAVIGKSQENINKNNEVFQITSITKDNNKFNITIQNTGQLPVNITRLWIQNKTDPTFPISKFSINQVVAPGQTLVKVGQNLKLAALSSQAYDISLVTERGNVAEALVNSASQKPLYLQLFVLPNKVSAAFSSTTLLLTVTNNMSNNGILTNLVPHVDISNPIGSTVTLISKPDNYTMLKGGNTAFFKWQYNIAGNIGQKINFTASLKNGYLNNYAVGNITIVAPYAGFITNTIKKSATYTASATDDVIDMDTTNANPTILYLPDATTDKGKIFFIKKDDTSGNVLMIDPSGSQTIDGFLLNLNLTSNKETAILQSDGSNFIRLDRVADDDNSFRGKGATLNRWYGTAITQSSSDVTSTWTANVLRVYPFVVPKTVTIDRMQVEITTAANPTSTTCRMGIYTDNGNEYPFKLVSNSDAGTFDNTGSIPIVKTKTFASSITLYSGLYWLGLDCGNAATSQGVFRGVPVSAVPNVLGYSSTMGQNQAGTGWTVNFNFAALPTTYPSGGTILTNSVPPMILVRLTG